MATATVVVHQRFPGGTPFVTLQIVLQALLRDGKGGVGYGNRDEERERGVAGRDARDATECSNGDGAVDHLNQSCAASKKHQRWR